MKKSVLVMKEPEDCTQCLMFNGADECILQDDDANFNADTLDELRKGCPLRPLPEKDMNCYFPDELEEGYANGWNACIDEIARKNETQKKMSLKRCEKNAVRQKAIVAIDAFIAYPDRNALTTQFMEYLRIARNALYEVSR